MQQMLFRSYFPVPMVELKVVVVAVTYEGGDAETGTE